MLNAAKARAYRRWSELAVEASRQLYLLRGAAHRWNEARLSAAWNSWSAISKTQKHQQKRLV